MYRVGIRDRLRELVGLDVGERTKPGWTLARLAEKAGVTYRTAQNWLGGARDGAGQLPEAKDIPSWFVAAAAEILAVDPGWLLTGTAPPASDAEARLGAVRRLVQPGAPADARVLHAVSLLLAAPESVPAAVGALLDHALEILEDVEQGRRPDGRASG
jgi:transcriptional regulator with XRE-family HTH domain